VLRNKNIIVFIPAFIWAGIITIMSLLPKKRIPIEVFTISDKLIHASIYGFLTLLFLIAIYLYFYPKNSNKAFANSFIISAILAFVLGVVLEFFQESMEIGRTGDWKDALANLFGIIIVYPTMKIFNGLDLIDKVLVKE